MSVRWGIVGPGRMAAVIAPEFARADGAKLVAVASRSQTRADEFAREHGIAQAFEGLEPMLDHVDAVYVASPHSAHADECARIAAAGRHLLVEKSLATSVAEVDAIAAAARSHGVFCMEAMWTRFLPAVVELRRRVAAGAIGEVRSVQGDLHAFRAYDPGDRLFAPELGGGALLDLGVYVVAFAHDFLGAPSEVRCVGHLLPNGVDGTATMALGYPGGRTASLSCSFESPGPGRMVVMGTEAFAEVAPRFHHPSVVEIHRGDDVERVELPPVGSGYSYEIAEATRRIEAGERESPVMPLAASREVAAVLAECRSQLGAA